MSGVTWSRRMTRAGASSRSSSARIAGIAASDPELFAEVTAGADKDFDAAVTALLTPYLDASLGLAPQPGGGGGVPGPARRGRSGSGRLEVGLHRDAP